VRRSAMQIHGPNAFPNIFRYLPLKKSADALFSLSLPANSSSRSSRMAIAASSAEFSNYSTETRASNLSGSVGTYSSMPSQISVAATNSLHT
jgi:hypothetical protein